MSPKPGLRLRWMAFSQQKYGNRPAENEDALQPAPGAGVSSGPAGFACALADGATQTSFAGLWARLLVEEVHKLGAYAGEGGAIEESHVEELTPNFAEGDFFEAAEAFGSGDLPRTLAALRRHWGPRGSFRPGILPRRAGPHYVAGAALSAIWDRQAARTSPPTPSAAIPLRLGSGVSWSRASNPDYPCARDG